MKPFHEMTDEELRREGVRLGYVEPTSHFDAAARSVGDALTIGLGDEIAGEMDAFGHSGAEAQRRRAAGRARVLRELGEARADRPVTSFVSGAATMLIPGTAALRAGRAVAGAGNAARALSAARAAGNVADVARLAPVAQAAGRRALYGSSVAHGAAYGAGSGDGVEGRALGAGIGAAAGGLGAGFGEALGQVGSILTRRGLNPTVRAERLLARELEQSVPTEQDLIRRLTASGMRLSTARAEARRMFEAGEGGRFTTADMENRARFAHPRSAHPSMTSMIPRGARVARGINAVGGPGEGIIGNTLDAQRAAFGRDVARQAERTFKPRGSGPGAGGRGAGSRRARQTSIDAQPPPTGLQDLAERTTIAARAQNEASYSAAYQTQLSPAQQAAAGRRMTGGAFKERARASAIDRAEEDIARLGDDLDNFQATNADANVISRAEAELADATRARDALQALGEGNGGTQLLNARAIDLYQRGLRHLADEAGGGATEGGRNIAAVRNTFMQNLRSVSPELSDAIGQARGFHALREARELGQSIFRPGKEAEVDALLRRTMTTDEQDSFMVGALDTIEARLGANDLSFVRSLQRNQNWRALVMRSARSKNAGQRLMDLIDDKVSELDSANFQRGGSQTAPIGQDIRRLTTDESELGFVQDVLDSGGSVQGPAMRLFARGVERFTKPGIRNPQVQTELARMLTQPGTQQNAATLATRLSMAPKASIFTPEAQSLQTGAGQVGSSVAQLGAATDPAVAEMTGVPGVARGVDALAHGRPGEGAQELAFAGMGLIPFVRGGRLALGAATGLGATAAGAGVAQAQEDQGQERDTMRREMASIQDQIAQIESERSVLAAASRLRTPEAISEAQRVLQGRSLYNHDVDGDWGPIMREAAERFEAQNVARLQPLQARLGELQQQESLQELTVSPEEEARRQALLGFGMAGGGLLGKFGLPIPRRIPGIGRLSGALGRSGTVRGVERKLGEQTAGANAVQFPSTPIVRRTAVHDAEAAARAARVNEFWTLGGARERVPFRVGAGARPEIRQRAVEAPRLFQPPRFSGEDYGYMGLGALDVGGALSALPAATQELAEAERAARAHPESRANIIRVQHARDAVFRLELAARIGGGYIGGRVVGGYTSGYERLPRPSFSAAQAEQGRIARYVASSPAPRLRRQPK